MNHRLVLCCALVFALASIPARVTADSATGNSEYNKVCPNPEPVEHELAPGYKPTYYCDTLPPMSAVPVWTAQTITDCALTCNAPDCRGASWERSQGVCWRYVRNPSEGDGNVWITTSGAFAGQHSCPEPQECACSAEELRICNEKLQKCETSPTDCSSCPSQDCTPILKELNEWKIADGTCHDGMWKTQTVNGKKIIGLCGYTTKAALAHHPVSFDRCVEICDQDSNCRLANYDRKYQACYTASVTDKTGIIPQAGSDVILLLD